MNHIIVNVEPFTMEQDIYVYQDGVCTNQLHAPLSKLNETVKGLCDKFNINQVELVGSEDYLLKFKAELQNEFELNPINVDIVRR